MRFGFAHARVLGRGLALLADLNGLPAWRVVAGQLGWITVLVAFCSKSSTCIINAVEWMHPWAYRKSVIKTLLAIFNKRTPFARLRPTKPIYSGCCAAIEAVCDLISSEKNSVRCGARLQATTNKDLRTSVPVCVNRPAACRSFIHYYFAE